MIVDPRLKGRTVTWRYPGSWAAGHESYATYQARAHRRFDHFKLRQWLRTMTGYVVAQDVHRWYLFPVGLTMDTLVVPRPTQPEGP